MTIRTIAAAALALSLLAPTAFASNSFGNPNAPAGLEASNKNGDYLIVQSDMSSTKALAVVSAIEGKKRFNTGDYIDETNVERNQRTAQ